MFRGRFNDILEADKHYLAVDEDFGNIESVLDRFSDFGERQHIAQAALTLAMESHTFDHRMLQVCELLSRGRFEPR
jgi:hypothetical protein